MTLRGAATAAPLTFSTAWQDTMKAYYEIRLDEAVRIAQSMWDPKDGPMPQGINSEIRKIIGICENAGKNYRMCVHHIADIVLRHRDKVETPDVSNEDQATPKRHTARSK